MPAARPTTRTILLTAVVILSALILGIFITTADRTSEPGLEPTPPVAATPGRSPTVDALRGDAPFDVVVITLDTTRADHIGAYGFAAAETPTLDGLAAEGVLFRSAYSPVPLTLPAHASLFTGQYPFDHGVRDNAGYAVGDDLTTLAESLQQNGYATAAFVASYVLAPRWGLAQGFDVYQDGLGIEARRAALIRDAQRPADEVIDDALAWLDGEREGPYFLWVHLYDPHVPYAPPEPYRSRHAADPYSGEIAFADAQIARLLERVRRDDDRTVVVVAGDHGESLGAHGELEHGFFVYEEATRIPLIISLPAAELRGIEIGHAVSLIDVMPTVLDANGIDIPPGTRGVSLLGAIAGSEPSSARVVYSETFYPRLHYGWSELAAVQDDRFKLIMSSDPELYDLQQDPQETANLVNDRRDEYDRLRERLEGLLAAAQARDASIAVDAEARSTLEALGYIAGPGASTDGGPAPAPRSKIEVYMNSLRARVLMAAGDLEGAAQRYNEILDEDPEVLIAYERLGEIYMLQGQPELAAETFSFAVPLRPDWPEIHIKLAEAQIAAGDPDLAERTLTGALRLTRPDAGIHCMLGYIKEVTPDYAAAREHYRSCQELDSESPEPLLYMARMSLELGDLAAAERDARRALALDETVSGPHYTLAQVHAERGESGLAFDEYTAELENTPDHAEAHFGLAMMHGEAGRSAEERRHLEAILAAHPDHALAGLFLGNLLLQQDAELERAVELVSGAVEQPLSRQDLAAGYFILSSLHQRLGNAELAQQYLQRAESLRAP